MNTINYGCVSVRIKCVMAFTCTLLILGSAHATVRMEYQAVVTNVPDGNTVVISNRILKGGTVYNRPLTIRLDGIESPDLSNTGGAEARILLEKLALGKEVLVSELFDSGVSRGACLFVSNDTRRYAENDCINFLLVSNGLSRFTGYYEAFNFDSRETEEAQRQAQVSHIGVWGTSTATSVQLPIIISNSSTIVSSNRQMSIKVDSPASENVASVPDTPSVSLLRVSLTVGVGLLAFLGLVFWFRR